MGVQSRYGLRDAAVGVAAALSGLAALAAHTHSTGTSGSDLILAAGLGIVTVLAAARAPRWAWVVASLVTAAVAPGVWLAVPAATLALALMASRLEPRHRPLVGAVIGGLLLQVLLRLPTDQLARDALAAFTAVGCLLVTGLGSSASSRLRRLLRVGAGAVAVAVGCLLLSLLLARHDVATGLSRAQAGLAAARQGDGGEAATSLDSAARSFAAAHGQLDAWWAQPARWVPGVGQQARALSVLAAEGSSLADAAATASRSAGIDDLKVVDGRLDLDAVRSIAQPLEAVDVALGRAAAGITRARSPWLIGPVAHQVQAFERSVADARSDTATAAVAVDVLPDLLGGSGRRSYFVAFGTPAETRELGGFMGAYAILNAEDGKLTLRSTHHVRNLNVYFSGGQLTDPSVLPNHYLAMLPQRFWHNLTGTPDFPTMATAFQQLWRSPNGDQFDGMLYMDPATLAGLLSLTGPVRVPGYDHPLTSRTAADFLLREQYLAFPNDDRRDDDRHDFLVEAAENVFDELTTGEMPPPRRVASALAPAVRGRRLLLHSFHPQEQALFERLHVDGAMPEVRGDFLSVRASNRGLNKIDALMHRTIAYDATVDPGRNTVRSTVTVTVRNDAPPGGLPRAVIGNSLHKPAGTNSTTVAVYSPLSLLDVKQDGRSISRGATEEYDRYRYSALVDVPPGDEVTVTFELEGAIDVRDGYHLDVVPQPLVNDDRLTVTIRGSAGWLATDTPAPSQPLDESRSLDAAFVHIR